MHIFPKYENGIDKKKENEIKIGKQHQKDGLKALSAEHPDIFSELQRKTGLIQFKLTLYKQVPHVMPMTLMPTANAEASKLFEKG